MPLAAIIKAGSSLALPLAVASAGLALFFFYASLPDARPHREVAAEQASRERLGRGIAPMPRPEGEGAGTSGLLSAARSAEGPPQVASADSSAPTAAPTPKPTAPPSTISNVDGITPNVDVPAVKLPSTDTSPSHPPGVPDIISDGEQPGVSVTTAQPPVTPALAPPLPTTSNDAERFVPVVFTHKDTRTALRTFAELQRRYPKLMAHRQSELQTVDTGKNGIWYRLVVLPVGSHQEASETCGRLQAAGYDRCWVKAY